MALRSYSETFHLPFEELSIAVGDSLIGARWTLFAQEFLPRNAIIESTPERFMRNAKNTVIRCTNARTVRVNSVHIGPSCPIAEQASTWSDNACHPGRPLPFVDRTGSRPQDHRRLFHFRAGELMAFRSTKIDSAAKALRLFPSRNG